MLNNEIGIMQGRLLPKFRGRYQAHPLGYWHKEFTIAKNLGLSLIEFIFDYNDYQKNPLMSIEGRKEIISISYKSNVKVKTVCADYFMINKLIDNNDKKKDHTIDVLIKLIKNCDEIGIDYIILPFVDESSLKNSNDEKFLCSIFKELETELNKYNCSISIESDLSPKKFSRFLEKLNSKKFSVNYDIGNSASNGYDIKEEFNAYGNKISVIHLKDRLFNGGPVKLGEGNANFELLFDLIYDYKFYGPIIFQTFRDEQGINVFKEQFRFLKNFLN